mmetsp:Transcript_60381/g.148162  ORF Transcript_60381/g.148162 Transcript_60381/m.148162 type:complete len:105 (+) Transcript_60381:858-1172(+)
MTNNIVIIRTDLDELNEHDDDDDVGDILRRAVLARPRVFGEGKKVAAAVVVCCRVEEEDTADIIGHCVPITDCESSDRVVAIAVVVIIERGGCCGSGASSLGEE